MEMRPIPAFYCCYLLRSTNTTKPSTPPALYVGSTPNPRRRLAQHNGGRAKGGAARTAIEKLQPWYMACIVTGFPSSIAALQFEWAWQNSHLTRRIAEDERITIRAKTKSTKDGRLRKRPPRPRMSLSDKLSNLHLLLRVSSFARWPLDVRFFSDEVYEAWLRYTSGSNIPIRSGIAILSPHNSGEIKDLSVDYVHFKAQLEQSISSLADGKLVHCVVCAEVVGRPAAMAFICPQEGCRVVSHMKCLADKFIREEGQDGLVPTTGSCPACKANLRWIDLVKELSLRTRGEKVIAKLMRKPRGKRAKIPDTGKLPSSKLMADTDTNGDFDDDDNEDDTNDTDDELCMEDVIDEPLIDEAGSRFDDCVDDIMSVTSAASDVSQSGTPAKAGMQKQRLEIVIEDSEQDEQDMIF